MWIVSVKFDCYINTPEFQDKNSSFCYTFSKCGKTTAVSQWVRIMTCILYEQFWLSTYLCRALHPSPMEFDCYHWNFNRLYFTKWLLSRRRKHHNYQQQVLVQNSHDIHNFDQIDRCMHCINHKSTTTHSMSKATCFSGIRLGFK